MVVGNDLGNNGRSQWWTTAGDKVGDNVVMTWATRMARLTADDGGVDGGQWKRGL